MGNNNDIFSKSIDCTASVWINANAGSGKTYTLIYRIVKLLLTQRKKILCLTYTKIATNELQERLREIFYNINIYDDTYCISLLKKIDINPSTKNIDNAKAILFQYSEHVKICTIHSFCLDVLDDAKKEDHRNFQSSYDIITTNELTYYLSLSIDNVIQKDNIMQQFEEVIKINNLYWYDSILKTFKHFFLSTFIYITRIPKIEAINLINIFGFKNLYEFDNAKNELFNDIMSILKEIILLYEKYISCKETYCKFIKEIEKYTQNSDISDFDETTYLYDILFVKQEKGDLKKHTRLARNEDLKPLLKTNNEIDVAISKLQDTLLHYQTILICNKIIHHTELFLELCCLIAKEYLAFIGDKITFDDIINRVALCTESQEYSWIFEKIDQSIDHMLIDEAQDNSNTQWEIITKITSEFFNEKNDTDTPRTLFVVGDIKQSIYSFQDANPSKFLTTRATLEKMAKNANFKWYNIELIFSYRSKKKILDFVDTLFNSEYINENFLVETSNKNHISHITNSNDNTGQVIFTNINNPDLSENIEDINNHNIIIEKNIENTNCHLLIPKFQRNQTSKKEFLIADKIANIVYEQIKNNKLLEYKNRPVKASDFLILLRKKGGLYQSIINAFQNKNILINFTEVSETPIFKYLCILKNFIIHPEINRFFFAILEYPPFYLNTTDLLRIRKHTKKHNYSTDIESLKELYPDIHKTITNHYLKHNSPIIETVISVFTDKQIYSLEKFFIYKNTSEIIEEFLNTLNSEETEIIMRTHTSTLKGGNNKQQNGVNLMTIHSAKGTEANIVVYIHDCDTKYKSKDAQNTSILSSKKSSTYCAYVGKYKKFFKIQNLNNLNSVGCHILDNIIENITSEDNLVLAEEDRILYVALTRAKYELNIVYYNLTKKSERGTNTTNKGVSHSLSFTDFIEKKEFENKIDITSNSTHCNNIKTKFHRSKHITTNENPMLSVNKNLYIKKVLTEDSVEASNPHAKLYSCLYRIIKYILNIKNDREQWLNKQLSSINLPRKDKRIIINNILNIFNNHLKQYQNSEKIETDIELCFNTNKSEYYQHTTKIDLLISNIQNCNTITVINFAEGRKNDNTNVETFNNIKILQNILGTKINFILLILCIETQEYERYFYSCTE